VLRGAGVDVAAWSKGIPLGRRKLKAMLAQQQQQQQQVLLLLAQQQQQQLMQSALLACGSSELQQQQLLYASTAAGGAGPGHQPLLNGISTVSSDAQQQQQQGQQLLPGVSAPQAGVWTPPDQPAMGQLQPQPMMAVVQFGSSDGLTQQQQQQQVAASPGGALAAAGGHMPATGSSNGSPAGGATAHHTSNVSGSSATSSSRAAVSGLAGLGKPLLPVRTAQHPEAGSNAATAAAAGALGEPASVDSWVRELAAEWLQGPSVGELPAGFGAMSISPAVPRDIGLGGTHSMAAADLAAALAGELDFDSEDGGELEELLMAASAGRGHWA
jgi:hypothetical protein